MSVTGADAGPTVEEILADEDKLMSSQKLDRARKMLGLSEEQVRQAIRQARDDLRNGGGQGQAGTGETRVMRRTQADSQLTAAWFVVNDGRVAVRAWEPVW